MGDESLRVAVRVRPFNQREKDRQSKCIIEMKGPTTVIRNPENSKDTKQFSFDYSYWSHDGFLTKTDGYLDSKPGSKYASQQDVFNDLGRGVLNNAFQGYNCSLFAYGQTGSGKSYSLIGYGTNKGIVPITCDELFKVMEQNNDKNKRYEVTFSMLEIYNEQVRDLLSKENPKGGLPIRQTADSGSFYVQGLKQTPVGSFIEIEKRMEQGTASRTVASTNMNATSSRAHTLVAITFDQIFKDGKNERKKSSVMNLVDLAGSERADSTGATGDRLKEGANINKSLSALGNVISALAELSSGKKKVVVPYRDSVLTKLLANALGGNSKTVMMAALSPADINYDETLSTLRYADRAKKIKNKAVVNEDPMDKLIRELKEENEKLRLKISKASSKTPEVVVETNNNTVTTKPLTEEEMDKMRKEMLDEAMAQLMLNQEKIEASENTEKAWEEKLKLARAESFIQSNDERKKNEPHFVNINEDKLLSGVVYHYIHNGKMTIGRKDAKPAPDICFSGLSIMKNHATIMCENNEVEITPSPGSRIKINGAQVNAKRTLFNKDRILFGSNHLYLFVNPLKSESIEDIPEEISWEFAQMEIAMAQGFVASDMSGLSKDKQITQEQVLNMLPLVSEVNAISEELNKYRTFDVVLLSVDDADGANMRATKVIVQMTDLLTGNIWNWERGKFINRRYLMQDLYQTMLDGDSDVEIISKDEDPFWEPIEDCLIGTCSIFLQSLAYMLDFEDCITITDFKGKEEGSLSVHLLPCTANGRPLGEESYVDDPKDILGQQYNFKVQIKSAEVINPRYKLGFYVQYFVNGEQNFKTPIVKNLCNSRLNYAQMITFASLNEQHLNFFENGCITFLAYGLQEEKTPDPKLMKLSTKDLRQMQYESGLESKSNRWERRASTLLELPDMGQVKSELILVQRKCERLEQKEKRIQELCRNWASKSEAEKEFLPFYNAVSAIANSTGRKLKARAQLVSSMLKQSKMFNKSNLKPVNEDQSDTVSVYVFGENEEEVEMEAKQNGGFVPMERLNYQYGSDNAKNILESRQRLQQRRQSLMPARPPSSLGAQNGPGRGRGNQEGPQTSKACVLQ